MQAYDYDAMGRLEKRRGWQTTGEEQIQLEPRGAKVQEERFGYDGFGRLLLAQNSQSRVSRSYDGVGNLEHERLEMSVPERHSGRSTGQTFTWQHEYDEIGTRTASTRPDGRHVQWQTYGSGHVHGLMLDGQSLANFERDDAHRETQRELGNGLTQATQYDRAGRLALQTLRGTGSAWVAKRGYRYDSEGRLSHIEDVNNGGRYYRYDRVDRLIHAQSHPGEEHFIFDPAGNMDIPTEHEHTFGLASWPGRKSSLLDNLLKEYAGTRYDYDERGNLVKRTRNGEQTTFTWDSFGRLEQAKNVHVETTFRYDALGRRILKHSEPT